MPTVTVTTGGETAACTYTLGADPVPVGAVAMPAGNGVDDTAALVNCVRVALAAEARPRIGPSGEPQAVIYFPADTYRIAGFVCPSNLHLLIDAAAVIQLPANRGITNQGKTNARVALFGFGSESNTPAHVSNVSIGPVGSAWSDAKQAFRDAHPAVAAVDVASCYTVNLDPADAGCTNYAALATLVNVTGAAIDGCFVIQNDTNQPLVKGEPFAWPTTGCAAILPFASPKSPLGDPAGYIQPRDVSLTRHRYFRAPRGFGGNQVNAVIGLRVFDVVSVGGTALRLETDGAQNGDGTQNRGATVDQVTGGRILCVNGNRAVALSPHSQRNGTVTLDGVRAVSCYEGVVCARDHAYPGWFDHPVITNLQVDAGPAAQLDDNTAAPMYWRTGASDSALFVAKQLAWDWSGIAAPTVTGVFTHGVVFRA